jgi:hypothetical protein
MEFMRSLGSFFRLIRLFARRWPSSGWRLAKSQSSAQPSLTVGRQQYRGASVAHASIPIETDGPSEADRGGRGNEAFSYEL